MKNLVNVLMLFVSLHLFSQSNTATLSAIIIGSGSPKFNTERSGPSVLISYKDTTILIDMGNGTQGNLNAINVKTKSLNGLLFTHHHLDHNEEFAPLFIKALLGGTPFVIAGPNPTQDLVDATLKVYREDIEYRLEKSKRSLKDVSTNFTVKTLNGNDTFTIGAIKISTTAVNHTIATQAYRFDAGETSIVISGDLIYSKSLSVLAKNADYLIIDSGGAIKEGQTSKKGGRKSNKKRAHLNLDESSKMAQDAKVKNLVLTHFTATTINEEATSKELKKNYSGTIIYAKDLMTLPLSNNHTQIEKKSSKKTNSRTSTEKTDLNFNSLLTKMDQNNDGKISKAEAKGKLSDNFEKRDKNSDGYITEDELKRKRR